MLYYWLCIIIIAGDYVAIGGANEIWIEISDIRDIKKRRANFSNPKIILSRRTRQLF